MRSPEPIPEPLRQRALCSFGTFPRVLSRHCGLGRPLALEQAVRKMTGLPAAKLGLRDRGLVREGYRADLVLFDPTRVEDTAAFREPRRLPRGIVRVFVNGRCACPDREPGGRWGVVIRHTLP